jgi:hypothetical protein
MKNPRSFRRRRLEAATLTFRTASSSVDLFGPVLAPTTNRSFLIATPGFAEFPGAVTPDTVMASAPFFEIDGDT